MVSQNLDLLSMGHQEPLRDRGHSLYWGARCFPGTAEVGECNPYKVEDVGWKRLRLIGTVLALLWLSAVIAAYYVVHKPFTLANALALGEAVAGLAGAGLVMALGSGIGLLLLRRLDLAPRERLVWAAAVGLGVVALAGLALGAMGLLRPWLLWMLTIVGIALTGRHAWRALRAAWRDSSWRPRDRFDRLLAGYCAVMLAVALIWALTPPTAWDGLVYHLTGPKLHLASGYVSHPLDLPYLGFPQLVEMLFAWGMGLTGERAAAAIHWFYGLLVVGVIVGGRGNHEGGDHKGGDHEGGDHEGGDHKGGDHKGSDHKGRSYGAVAVLLSAPSIVMLMGWPYVEMALVLYTTLSFMALACFWEDGSQARGWLVLSGVCAGLALSTKYTALALPPALGLALLVWRLAIGDWRYAIRAWLIVCGVALAIWSPWLIKNWLLTGNPVYPFFFRGVYWDDWRAWWYDRPGTGLITIAPWKLLAAPWDATIWGVEGAAGYSATIGPLFLALLPLLFLVWRRLALAQRRWLAAALAFCGVLYAFWLWGIARTALLLQTRLLFSVFGLLALVAGVAVDGLRALPSRPLNVDWLVRAVIVTVLTLTLAGTLLSFVQERPLGVLLGFESRQDFLSRRLGWYAVAMDYVNRELPADAVVLFLWEPRSYDCRVECRPDALLDRWLHTTHIYGYDAAAIADAWRAQGVTHVLLYRTGYKAIVEAGFDPVTEADIGAFDALCSDNLQEVKDFGGVYVLYRLGER